MLSFGQEVFGHGQTLLQFHRRPTMTADELILAPQTLAEVQRQVVEVARHKDRLLAARPAPQARACCSTARPASARRTRSGT